MKDTHGTDILELVSMMKTFIQTTGDQAKKQDSQYETQQSLNKATERRIDEISEAIQNFMSTTEKDRTEYVGGKHGHGTKLFILIVLLHCTCSISIFF